MANLSYIKNFRFSSSAKDELGYCLTSVEAAIEYIRQGSLSTKPPVSPPCQPALPRGARGTFGKELERVGVEEMDGGSVTVCQDCSEV